MLAQIAIGAGCLILDIGFFILETGSLLSAPRPLPDAFFICHPFLSRGTSHGEIGLKYYTYSH